LRPENILIHKSGKIQIGGFTLARPISSAHTIASEQHLLQQNYLHYRSPELLLNSDVVDEQTDIWSLGCIFAELLNRKVLFDGTGVIDQLEHIVKLMGKPDVGDITCSEKCRKYITMMEAPESEGSECGLSSMFSSINHNAQDMLSKMLKFNPNKRITALEALRHPYFASIHREKNIVWSATQFTFDLREEMMDSDSIKQEMYKMTLKSQERQIIKRIEFSEDQEPRYTDKYDVIKA
jgi:serine/threonine protein kinase